MEHTLPGHINALHALSGDQETRRALREDLSDETLRGVISDAAVRNKSRVVLEGVATFLRDEVALQTRTRMSEVIGAVEHAGTKVKEEDEDPLLEESMIHSDRNEAIERKARTQTSDNLGAVEYAGAKVKEEDGESLLGDAMNYGDGNEPNGRKTDIV